jgi:F-type H+-transporting ATPase subunit a
MLGEGGHNAVRKFLSPRNIVITLGILGLMLASAILIRIPLPAIVLPAEPVIYLGNIKLTNTAVATLIADLTVIILAVLATRKMKDVPRGLQNLVEWFVEAFYNLSEDVAGKANVKKFFVIFMTILLFVLFCNWWAIIPGVDSVGRLEPLEYAYQHAGITSGWPIKELPLGVKTLTVGDGAYTLTDEQKAELDAAMAAEAEHGAEEEDAHHGSELGYYVVAPYVRPAATDLNVGLALALISVFWTQVVGVRALGAGYFRKFFLPTMTGMKAIDLIVGLLELVSEFAKIISFTFRLFGNIFAGMVLLFVMTFLIPFFVPLPFYVLEIFVGFMQAFVFAILTLIFMTMATISHEHAEEHH